MGQVPCCSTCSMIPWKTYSRTRSHVLFRLCVYMYACIGRDMHNNLTHTSSSEVLMAMAEDEITASWASLDRGELLCAS